MSGAPKAEKQVSVSTTSTSMIGPRTEALDRVIFIHYPVQLKKDTTEVWALIDSRSEFNAIPPAYTKKPSLWVWKTDVGAQKIDGSILETYSMVIPSFQFKISLERLGSSQRLF